ncbi:hypothetical protein MNBD_GAMMA25-1431, partial [hydrothermal vent metagenome]
MSGIIEQIELGVKHHLTGDLESALNAYLAALEMDPDNASAHNNLGFIY